MCIILLPMSPCVSGAWCVYQCAVMRPKMSPLVCTRYLLCARVCMSMYSVTTTHPHVNIQVYASDPWHTAANAAVANMYINDLSINPINSTDLIVTRINTQDIAIQYVTPVLANGDALAS